MNRRNCVGLGKLIRNEAMEFLFIDILCHGYLPMLVFSQFSITLRML
ncbi:MAG: hypothetical protein V3V31_07405 [Methylococcales bacterium]